MNISVTITKELIQFFQANNLNYIFIKEEFLSDNNPNSSISLDTFIQIWKNENLRIRFSLTKRKEKKTEDISYIISIRLCKYSKDEFLSSLSLNDYFEKQIKRPILLVNDFEGQTLEEKLNHFFVWFQDNIDQRLIKIFRGEDWIEIPFDWRGYK